MVYKNHEFAHLRMRHYGHSQIHVTHKLKQKNNTHQFVCWWGVVTIHDLVWNTSKQAKNASKIWVCTLMSEASWAYIISSDIQAKRKKEIDLKKHQLGYSWGIITTHNLVWNMSKKNNKIIKNQSLRTPEWGITATHILSDTHVKRKKEIHFKHD